MHLSVIEARLAVCRLDADWDIPAWANVGGEFVSITRTSEELSIVCPIDSVLPGVPMEGPWRGFKVQGQLIMTLIGVVAALANPLAESDVAIFAISTYDTDYILVHEPDFETAVQALTAAGHTFQ